MVDQKSLDWPQYSYSFRCPPTIPSTFRGSSKSYSYTSVFILVFFSSVP